MCYDAAGLLFEISMELDDEVCLCFHVTKRKLLAYLRINRSRMRRPSQLSECGGAGTGCGWCVGYLKRLFSEQVRSEIDNSKCDLSPAIDSGEPTAEQHRSGRNSYLEKRSQPPKDEPCDSSREARDELN